MCTWRTGGIGGWGDRSAGLHVACWQKSVQRNPCNVYCCCTYLLDCLFGKRTPPPSYSTHSCPGGPAPEQVCRVQTCLLSRYSAIPSQKTMLWWDFASAALPPYFPLNSTAPSEGIVHIMSTSLSPSPSPSNSRVNGTIICHVIHVVEISSNGIQVSSPAKTPTKKITT